MRGEKIFISISIVLILFIALSFLMPHISPPSATQKVQDNEYDKGYEAGYEAAREEFEGNQEDEYDTGYDDGHSEGYLDGRRECLQEVKDKLIFSDSDQWEYNLEEAAIYLDDYLNDRAVDGVKVSHQEAIDALDAFWCLIYGIDKMK